MPVQGQSKVGASRDSIRRASRVVELNRDPGFNWLKIAMALLGRGGS